MMNIHTENDIEDSPKFELPEIPDTGGFIRYIPSNLNLEDILEINPPSFKYYIDNFKYILGLLYEIPCKNKDLADNLFISINSPLIQKFIHNYKDYLGYLISNNILETDNHFIPKVKSIGYRFTENYQTIAKPIVISKHSLVKRVDSSSPYDISMKFKYNYLYKWFNPNLKIDWDSAYMYLNSRLYVDQKSKLANPKLKMDPLLRFNASFLAINKIQSKDFHFSIDKSVGRCHTSLTSMHSMLRNFITYNNLNLVSIDIKNSQPCFSGLLLNPEFFSNFEKNEVKSPLFNINNIKLKNIRINNKDILLSIMLVKSAESNDSSGFQSYLEKVQNGTLYEYLEEQIYIKTGTLINDRKKLKEVIFTVLFTDNRFIGQPEAQPKRLFRDVFPDVYEVFKTIKRHNSTALPCLLQAIEAELMLNFVAKRISKERPDMPIFTIHDSIACPVGNEDYVMSIIEEEMLLRTGMKPTLKPEYWSPDNVTQNQSLSPLKLAM